MADLPHLHRTRRQFLADAAILGAGATLGGGLLSSCTGAKGGATGKRAKSLFIAGFQWGPPTNFNPLSPTAAWPAGEGSEQYIYEALFGFDLLDGSLKPALAKSLQFPDKTTAIVTLQNGTHWQDGKPLTADDVVFTFELAKHHKEISYATFWDYVSAVTKQNDSTVKITLNSSRLNPGMVKGSLAGTYILPAHVWQGVEKKNAQITQYTNMKPMGSGPYTLANSSATQVSLTRTDSYWGKSAHGSLPHPQYIVHPIFKDNDAGDLAFQQGGVDVSQQFTPQIWQMWENKHLPVRTWYDKSPYHVPGSIPMLVVNTTKKGLDNVKVRLALAHAINYAQIANTAMSRYSKPANSSLILPTGAEGEYFNAANVKANGWNYDQHKAVQILEKELHCKKGSDGIYRLPDGTRLGPWTAQTPTGWSDWQTGLQVVASSAKAVGIDIQTQFPQAPQVTQAVQNGDFDLACWGVSGVSPATPWQRFRDVLDSRGVPKAGQSAFYNYGRFHDSRVAPLLDKVATLTGPQAKEIYTELDRIFMQNAPMIPLMYRPLEFFEYNASTWTGWPDDQHPTAPPQFSGAGARWLYQIKPKSA